MKQTHLLQWEVGVVGAIKGEIGSRVTREVVVHVCKKEVNEFDIDSDPKHQTHKGTPNIW